MGEQVWVGSYESKDSLFTFLKAGSASSIQLRATANSEGVGEFVVDSPTWLLHTPGERDEPPTFITVAYCRDFFGSLGQPVSDCQFRAVTNFAEDEEEGGEHVVQLNG